MLHTKVSVLGCLPWFLQQLVSDLFAVLVQVEGELGVPQLLVDGFTDGGTDVSPFIPFGVNAVDQFLQRDKRDVVVSHLQIFELEVQVIGGLGVSPCLSSKFLDVSFEGFAVAQEDITS